MEVKKNTAYRARIADGLLEEKLDAMGAVLIEGPKWCGKTTTAEQAAKSVIYLADTDSFSQNMAMLDLHPQALLSGEPAEHRGFGLRGEVQGREAATKTATT